ncbi:hypothetical protein EX30DRAFT_372980 [Ascodesmis nigricans]|uniref:Uncharacterized protein n=1 Tax=Ascodesmis nigricans TaxID=341454 RepID=A0A4S2MT65_9PEZI|nr:hypothetical protein EX30DRAFT_372980 [Ascodesmis nigricans]
MDIQVLLNENPVKAAASWRPASLGREASPDSYHGPSMVSSHGGWNSKVVQQEERAVRVSDGRQFGGSGRSRSKSRRSSTSTDSSKVSRSRRRLSSSSTNTDSTFSTRNAGYTLSSSNNTTPWRRHQRELITTPPPLPRSRHSFSRPSELSTASTETSTPSRNAPALFNAHNDHHPSLHKTEASQRPHQTETHRKDGRHELHHLRPNLPPLNVSLPSPDKTVAITTTDDAQRSPAMAQNSYVPRSGVFPPPFVQYSPYYPRSSMTHGLVEDYNPSSNPLMRFADVAVMQDVYRESRKYGYPLPPPVQISPQLTGNSIDPLLRAQDPTSRSAISAQGSPLFHNIHPTISPAPPPSNLQPVEINSPLHPSAPSPSCPLPPDDLDIAANLKDYKPLTCSSCSPCTTKSPLRKVVSHIFGRNKINTRQIPPTLWYYICRKHYQRSRYRNPKGFAKQQVTLVREQCKRLREWGGVKDWIIKVRRREEQRQKKEKELRDAQQQAAQNQLSLQNRYHHHQYSYPSYHPSTDYDHDIHRYHPRAHEPLSPTSPSDDSDRPPCLPDWVYSFVGPHKTLDEVFALLDLCYHEVSQNGGIFPDIEILPNVDPTYLEEFRGELEQVERPKRRRLRGSNEGVSTSMVAAAARVQGRVRKSGGGVATRRTAGRISGARGMEELLELGM